MNAAVSSSVPIFVLGEKRRLELIERLRARADTWLRTWGSPSANRKVIVDVYAVSKEHIVRIEAASVKTIVGSIGVMTHLAVISNRNTLGNTLGLPRGMTAENFSSSVCPAIRDEALTDLAQSLVANVQTGAWIMNQTDARSSRESMADHFHRGWVASISVEDVELVNVLLSAQLVSWLQPHNGKVNAAAVSRRRAAILDESVRLQAVLGEATVSIGELAQLAIDDVIVLGSDISQPGSLTTSAGVRVASFSPGRAGVKRAALVVK